jgi:hypothetical protein
MLGQQRVGLDIEQEIFRRTFYPQFRVTLRQKSVIGGIDFDGVKSFRIEARRSSAVFTDGG